MAKKKKRTTKKKRRTTNPSPSPRKVGRSIGASILGLNINKAFKNAIPIQLGMLGTKWLAKRFGPDASETDPASWNWASYLKGGMGAVISGFIINMLKPGYGQLALEGGINLMLYKLIQNEMIANSPGLSAQLGEDYVPDEYVMSGTDELPIAYNQYGAFPADDRHRMPEFQGGAGVLEPPGRLGSDATVPVSALGDVDPYVKMFQE